MDQPRIQYLLKSYLNKNISEAELLELTEILIDDNDQEISVSAMEELVFNEAPYENYNPADWENIYNDIIKEKVPVIALSGSRNNQFSWIKIAAAAVILGAISLGVLFTINQNNKADSSLVINEIDHDLAPPDATNAIIILADGTQISLDSSDGLMAVQGEVSVTKNANGEIVYGSSIETGTEIIYNTIYNPKGSRVVSLTLSDGSKVWLNSASSLKYPVLFSASERSVEITGEAYFDVSRDINKPFTVKLNGLEVQVLGTEFNIKNYSDAMTPAVSLIEGSVKVQLQNKEGSVILRPGQQSLLNTSENKLQIKNSFNTEEVLAWKNEKFYFDNATIEEIMKEVSRWYDVDIIYEKNIEGEFVADISRNLPVSKLLQILELTNRVHFELKGKTIKVKP
jgi:transmembrane sensor